LFEPLVSNTYEPSGLTPATLASVFSGVANLVIDATSNTCALAAKLIKQAATKSIVFLMRFGFKS
jgi:hypothetical protein